MTTLNQQVGNDPSQTLARRIITQRQFGFTIGTYATSPLQLAGAYSTIGNDGVFCPPAPVQTIKDDAGQPLPVPRKPCSRQMTPQVAREAANVLIGDSSGPRTAASAVSGLQRGRRQSSGRQDGHSERRVADHGQRRDLVCGRDAPASRAPWRYTTRRARAARSRACRVRQMARRRASMRRRCGWTPPSQKLLGSRWEWPGVNDVPDSIPVTRVTNQPLDQATAALTAQGFKVVNFGQLYPGVRCGSAAPYDTVAYYSPKVAVPSTNDHGLLEQRSAALRAAAATTSTVHLRLGRGTANRHSSPRDCACPCRASIPRLPNPRRSRPAAGIVSSAEAGGAVVSTAGWRRTRCSSTAGGAPRH